MLKRMAVASFSGGAAATATYCWRSPIDTLYKQNFGWRAADAPLLSWDRFITVPPPPPGKEPDSFRPLIFAPAHLRLELLAIAFTKVCWCCDSRRGD